MTELSQEEWDHLREESRQELPEALAAVRDLPDVLLPYQQKLLATTALCQLVVCEKSRRIGMTWGVGADAVLTAGSKKSAGGMDVLYIGFNLDMAREFIDVCAMWAKAFVPAASSVLECVFEDTDEDGDKHAIKAFRITFASGFEIMALTSKPRSLRGRQGYVIFDEAAFHDELGEMLKAAMALLMWGGKVLVISTHDGVDNPFNDLIGEIRAGKRAGEVVRVDFDQAVADGLYERIAMVTGKPATEEAKRAWIKSIFDFYQEDADEELRCIPKKGSGVYLSRAAIDACMTDANVVRRLRCPDGFELRPLEERTAFVEAWIEENIRPVLRQLDPARRTCLGEDFGRSIDLSVIAVGQELQDLSIDVPLIVELANCPIAQQRQVLIAIREMITRFGGAKFDATGNGLGLAEDMQELWGHDLVEAVKISTGWYLETMPKLKAHIEDRTMALPRDASIRDDLRVLRLVNGVPSVPPKREKGRHGDAAVALAMLVAAIVSEPEIYEFLPVPGTRSRLAGRPHQQNDFDDDMPSSGRFGEEDGAW